MCPRHKQGDEGQGMQEADYRVHTNMTTINAKHLPAHFLVNERPLQS